MVIACQACTSWQQVEVSPEAVGAGPPAVRVTRTDGVRLVIHDPRIAGDSLYGKRFERDTVLALSNVSRMAVQRPANAKNAAALTFIAATLGAALAWYAYFVAGS
jgi:hypothetical protein